MNKIFAILAIAALVCGSHAFSIRSLADDSTNTKTYRDRKDMPCATVAPSLYRAFQFYSLQDSSSSGRTATLKNYKNLGVEATLNWNMCTAVTIPEGCDYKPKSGNANYGIVSYMKDNKKHCLPMYEIQDGNSFDLAITSKNNKDREIVGIKMITKYPTNKLAYTTTFDIKCGTKTSPVVTADTEGNITISFNDKSACGEDLQKFVLFFQQNWVIPVIFIIVSLPLVFAGLKFLKKSLATIGFLGAAILVSLITTMTTNFMTFNTTSWIIFGVVCLIVSIIVAVVCYNSPTFATIAGGAALGYFGAQQLFVLYANLKHDNLPDVWMGVVYAIMVGLGVVVGWKLRKFCVILTTSMTGSYLFFFGIGSLAKNYPDLGLLEQNIRKQQFDGIDTWAWIYLGGTLVLFFIGAIYQHKKYGKKEDKEDGYEKDNGFNQQSDDFQGYY